MSVRLAIVVFCLLAGGPLVAPSAASSGAVDVHGALPQPARFPGNGAAKVGSTVYLFGVSDEGWPGSVLAHDLSTGNMTMIADVLPQGLRGSAVAAWGGSIYVLGGQRPVTYGDAIVTVMTPEVWRFDARTHELESLGPILPVAVSAPSAVSLDDGIYLFGGSAGPGSDGYIDAIVRFRPEPAKAELLEVRLPTPRAGMGGAPAGGDVAVLAGGQWKQANLGEVLVFRLSTMNVSVVAETAASLLWPSVATVGGFTYVIGGGASSHHHSRQIFRLVDSQTLQLMEARLPAPVSWAASAVDDDAILMYGGRTGCDRSDRRQTDLIVRYVPTQDRPWDPEAPVQVRPPRLDILPTVEGMRLVLKVAQACDTFDFVHEHRFEWGDGNLSSDRLRQFAPPSWGEYDELYPPEWENGSLIARHEYGRAGAYDIHVTILGLDGSPNETVLRVTVPPAGPSGPEDAGDIAGIGAAPLALFVALALAGARRRQRMASRRRRP